MARVTPGFLVDKSAFARMRIPSVSAVLDPLIRAGEVATCGMVALEILYSARGPRDFEAVRHELAHALVTVPTLQADFDRAIDVMEALAKRGEHRSARLPDLLIAAVAERTNLCVLHYDEDFDRIAAVTGQRVLWVVPRGSL
jgi:predicted nucleic acid-binding protein